MGIVFQMPLSSESSIDLNQLPDSKTLLTLMPHQKQFSNNSPESIEENTAGDSTLNEKAADRVRLHVEGQNENITTPPETLQADIAATARDVGDLTMGIEDES